MKMLIVFGSILTPIVMIIMQQKWQKSHTLFDVAALIAALTFGNIAATSIHQIIKDNTVFMTNIHGLFLNPYFLVTGAYLGVYLIYILGLQTIATSAR